MINPIIALSDSICSSANLTPQNFNLSIGNWLNKSTWEITYNIDTTVQQRDTANTVISSFNLSDIDDQNTLENIRIATIKSDSTRLDLLNRLRTASASQIDTWLTNNVTNLAQARTVLGAIIKVIAIDQRD